MIKQLFKLLWNRKRSNIFLLLEIWVTFLVLAAVNIFGLHYWERFRHPLGFSYKNVWSISAGEEGVDDGSDDRVKILKQIVHALKGFNEVEAVGNIQEGFYTQAYNYDTYHYEGRYLWSRFTKIADGCLDVLKIDLIQGRWFDGTDDIAEYPPIIINRQFRDELFGGENPVGKLLKVELGGKKEGIVRVIGVVSDFRLYGEYDRLRPFVLRRTTITSPFNPPATQILIRIRTDVQADLKARMMARLQQISSTWSFGITPIAEIRDAKLKEGLIWFTVLGIVAFFLMAMVALGLTGVLWQNVTERTKEIGLRRANGASIGAVFRQIAGEILVVTTIAVTLGIIFIAHFLFLDIIGDVREQTYFFGILIAVIIIYFLTVVCALYPGYMATRIQPAVALHYE